MAFGLSFFLSVNLPSQSTATVTIMLRGVSMGALMVRIGFRV